MDVEFAVIWRLQTMEGNFISGKWMCVDLRGSLRESETVVRVRAGRAGALKGLALSSRSNPEENSRRSTVQTRSTDAAMNSALAALLICSLILYTQGTAVHTLWALRKLFFFAIN